ncbi:response regulator [Rhizobium sp. FKL33]|uniref:response regulator n=1 Tax=Rhizobium sp. FKL33 TaxID=2562307 RepID=UPI0010C11390|nr:response regulator [Rhizobium sp. FKL33]
MTTPLALDGCAVLVVEDNYFVAVDTQRTLITAGAVVFGPAANEQDAMRMMQTMSPTFAVVDVNLGQGPSFHVAEALADRGVPFIFVTGYSDLDAPDRFKDIVRIEKPAPMENIVNELHRMKKDILARPS